MLLHKNTINNQMSITILGKEYDINLQTLDLSNNQLSSLPAEIEKLVNLKELILSNNQLVNMPDEIGKLVNLQTVSLSKNQFGLFLMLNFARIFDTSFHLLEFQYQFLFVSK